MKIKFAALSRRVPVYFNESVRRRQRRRSLFIARRFIKIIFFSRRSRCPDTSMDAINSRDEKPRRRRLESFNVNLS